MPPPTDQALDPPAYRADSDASEDLESRAPLPLGVCVLIWAAISGAGWALIALVAHFLL